MIYGHFESIGAYDTAQGLSGLFSLCLQNDDVQDFDTRWDQILSGTSEMPPENVLEGLYKNRLQVSEQLQTVFAMYNQELSRDRVAPRYQKLRKMVRQHIGQTTRTRNFKARNERIETGVLVKSHKGRNVSAERKVGESFQWKANGPCSRGDTCCFNRGSHPGQRAQSSSSSSRAPTQTDGRKPYQYGILRGESPSGLKGRKPCQNFLKGNCTESPYDFWHPPVCLNHKSESGCTYGDKCNFLHPEAVGQPSKMSEKGGAKGSVALLKETIHLGVSHDSPQRKSILRENEKLGSNHTVKFSKVTVRRVKLREKMGPSQGIIQKCEPQERNPWAPKFEERTQDETLEHERWARRDAWEVAEDVYGVKRYVLVPCRSLA